MNLTKNIPTHVGIIVDGNGRWATKRGLHRLAGHKEGVESIKRAISYAKELNIQILTFYVFSTENWKRDKEEVDGIFDLVRQYLRDNIENLNNQGVKLRHMGDESKLPSDISESLLSLEEKTKNNNAITVNLAVNYGARDELVRAFSILAKSGKTEITTKDISDNLYSAGLPDPDLIIRTSGEQRLSNFMLYQCAYAELYFTKVYWPSFRKKDFVKALKNYSKRDRRYGGNHKKRV